MNLGETFKIALRSLKANKLRSALTMLGIIIGVASVVTMVGVGAGARKRIEDQIRSLGANVLMILPAAASRDGVRQESGSGQSIIDGDALAMETELSSIRAAAPVIRGSFQIIAGNRNWRTTLNGTTASYFVVREWGLAAGRYFSGGELSTSAKVAVIGHTVAEELFGAPTAATGRDIRILNSHFTVIGVLADKGPSGVGRDQNDILFVPISTMRQRLVGGANQVNRDAVDYILVKAVSDDSMVRAQQEIEGLLRLRHGLRAKADDDFSIADPAETMAAQTASTRILSWLLASIASVSLVVGGISIMNIMLVSVTERRREIGLRMALGARKRHIKTQFLIEAVMLCLFGGAIGLAAGIGAAFFLAHLAGWPVFLSPGAMGLALLFAMGVGVFFGYYPAKRAASEDPILCLRAD